MKTIREWLEELPEPYRTQAIENVVERNPFELAENIEQALWMAFSWMNSPQGGDYWCSLHDKLMVECYEQRKEVTKQVKRGRKNREVIYAKYEGHCGYCGCKISITDMQVDHMVPKCGGGSDVFDNLMPSCRQCNHYKRSMNVEGFRDLLRDLHKRVGAIYIHKVAVNFGMAQITPFNGKFFFEQFNPPGETGMRNYENKNPNVH